MPEQTVRRVVEDRYSRQEVLEALGLWPVDPTTVVRVMPLTPDLVEWAICVIQVDQTMES